jgi:HEAT repeat protein
VKDPVAVPYLARLLELGRFEQIAVDGLRRIGNEEAAQVLIATLESNDEETVMFGK